MKNYLNLISKKKNQVTMIVKTVDVSLMKSTMIIRFVITVDSILKKVNSPSAVAAIKNLLHTLHYEMRHTACINNLLAAGFCERWPKAWRVWFAPVREQLLIVAKNLPLTHDMYVLKWPIIE